MTMFHYTCDHGRRGLGQSGFLQPNPQPVLGGYELIWLTDMETPDRRGLGLTSDSLSCDRMAYRYIVPDGEKQVERWVSWAARHFIPAHTRVMLEQDRMPSRWFVCERRLWAVRDRFYKPHEAGAHESSSSSSRETP